MFRPRMTDASKKKGLSLPVRIIIGLVAGTGWAVLSSILGWSSFTMDWVAPFGDIFINLLKLIAIPLVLFSIISGVSGLSDITKLGRTGMGMLGLYLATTFIAVGIESDVRHGWPATPCSSHCSFPPSSWLAKGCLHTRRCTFGRNSLPCRQRLY